MTFQPCSPDSLRQAFEYLRHEAIDAHLSGDGMRVLHLCTVALDRIGHLPRPDGVPMNLGEVRWVFFLGLYWMLDEWLTYDVNGALQHLVTDDVTIWDLKLIRFSLTTLEIPLNFESVDELKAASADWLHQRSRESDDVSALTAAVELAWYEDARSHAWRELADAWLNRCPPSSLLATALSRTIQRLNIQSRLRVAGQLPADQLLPDEIIQSQKLLIRAWRLYYEAKFDELDTLVGEIIARIPVESPIYPAFFRVLHFSRIHRESKESQFVSLSRRQYVESRQPALVCQILRDKRFESNYADLARHGFPDHLRSKRFTCFRMALLNQLHALRAWDIGAWLLGEFQRGQALLELCDRGQVEFARDGIIALRNSQSVPKPAEYPQFDKSIRVLDALPEDDRRSLVCNLLASPRIAWVSARRVLDELSDAIPETEFLRVAEWYARLEIDDFHSKGVWTHLEVWQEIFPRAQDAAELIDVLRGALVRKAARPVCWDSLHGTFVTAILHGRAHSAREILAVLLDTPCNEHHFNRYKFSILSNVAQRRKQFADLCIPWMKEYAEQRQDQVELFHLRQQFSIEPSPVDDSAFRSWIRERLVEFCNGRLAETGGTQHLGTQAYHEMMRVITWPDSETNLTRALIDLVRAEHVLFVNKNDPLRCLAVLAANGPNTQAEDIARVAMDWLENGVVGKHMGERGPLSAFHFNGAGEVEAALAYLLETLAERHCSLVGDRLSKWIMVEGIRRSSKLPYRTIRTALHLSIGMRQKDEALSIALTGIAEAVAQVGFSTDPGTTIFGFRSVILSDAPHPDLDAWLSSTAGKLCMEMWQPRLVEGARLSDPTAREAVALTIRRWEKSAIPLPACLIEVRERLGKDCRLRVRAVFRG